MRLDETARETRKVPRLLFGRVDFEQIAHEAVRLYAVEPRLLAPLQAVEQAVESAFESIDNAGLEPREAALVEQAVEPVLALDHEIEAPLAVIDVEGEKKFRPV